jgi:hypothetical protein
MRTDFTSAHFGDHSVATLVAQRLLNANMNQDPSDKSPPLLEDAKFEGKTLQAVKRFQQRTFKKAHPSGIVGPNTFEKLGLTTIASWPVELRSQPHKGVCWSAAASMLLGGVVPGPGLASTNGRGALEEKDVNVKLFATSLGWDYVAAQSMDSIPLSILRAPLWVGGNSLNSKGKVAYIHAIVLAGIYSYEWAGQLWGLLKFYDPYPSHLGRIIFMQKQSPQFPDGSRFSVRWFLSPKSFLRARLDQSAGD